MPYHWASDAPVLNLVLVKKKLPPRPDGISDGIWELLNLCWAQVPSERPNMKHVGDRLEALFLPPDVPRARNVNEDIIGDSTPIEKVVSALTQRGCFDLTSSIDHHLQ